MTISSYQRARFLLTVASLASFALCWFAGAAMGIPAHRDYEVSLLSQPSPAIALFVTLVLTIGCALLGSAIAGTIRYEAGLATAAIGLTALSIRGGPVRYVLFYSTGPQVFLTLTAELMILYAILGVAWAILWLLRNKGWMQDDPFRDGVADLDEPVSQKLLALATQVVTMSILMMLLCKSDQKPQVIASVALSAYLGTLAAHSLFPARPSMWYWIGPLVVGVVGYLFAFSGSTEWMIGRVGGTFAPELGRPLPLDYVGAGSAGAVVGYWTSRRWQRSREAEAEAAATPATSA
ncbi:MAG: hypothetical protein WBD40_10125 [Tepidisphaeraceae bacterium]